MRHAECHLLQSNWSGRFSSSRLGFLQADVVGTRKSMRRMFSVFAVLAAAGALLLGVGDAALPPGTSGKYHISDGVIHLKYGKLHLPEDEWESDEEGHLRYKWLEDDIVKMNDIYDLSENVDDDILEKLVKLPGGCELTEDQYEELEAFRKETHYVKKCYCEHGGVYCQLSKGFPGKRKI